MENYAALARKSGMFRAMANCAGSIESVGDVHFELECEAPVDWAEGVA